MRYDFRKTTSPTGGEGGMDWTTPPSDPSPAFLAGCVEKVVTGDP
jgi:hypothetical protein